MPKDDHLRDTPKVLLLAALGAILAVFWAQQLWRVEDWRTPLAWHQGGDALFNVLLAQNIAETGWYLENPRLGAPGTLETYSFPVTILGPMLAFKLLGIFVAPGAVVNAFYLLGWPLAAMVAAWVFLRLGLSPPLAAGLGVLFTALPAHAIRGEPHLFLANLALVPPGFWSPMLWLGKVLIPAGESGPLVSHWYLVPATPTMPFSPAFSSSSVARLAALNGAADGASSTLRRLLWRASAASSSQHFRACSTGFHQLPSGRQPSRVSSV